MPVSKTTMAAKPKFRTHIGDFTIYLDPLTVRGKMVGIRKPETDIKPKATLVSPKGNAVEQKYQDVETKELWTNIECHRKFVNGETELVVDKESLDAVKAATELMDNVINLSVHDVADVDRALYPADANGYVFIPDAKNKKNAKLATAFAAAIKASPDKAFVGVCRFRGHEGLYRVSLWRGYLCFQKQHYPGELNEHEPVELDVTSETNAIRKYFEKKTKPFDPTTYRNEEVERQRAALENPDLFTKDLKPEVPSDEDISDLLASLTDWD